MRKLMLIGVLLILVRGGSTKGAAVPPVALAATEPTIVEKGPHHRVWSRTVQDRTPDGNLITRTSQITELSSGMHRLTAQGEWVAASDELTLVDGGCAANSSAHWLGLSANINTVNAIQIVSKQKHFAAHFAGIALWDTATGRSVLFPVLDSIGELHLPNRVLYRNVVDGMDVDLLVVNSLAGVSQSIIFKKQFAFSLADLQLNEATTRILCYTAIDDAEEPQKRVTQSADGVSDENLNFNGMLTIGPGAAFLTDGAVPGEVSVAKNWVTDQNQARFLIESTAFSSAAPYLATLPAGQQAAARKRPVPSQFASISKIGSSFPKARLKRAIGDRMTMAKAQVPSDHSLAIVGKGFLVDWEGLTGGAAEGFRFEHSKTYYISGDFVISAGEEDSGASYLEPCVIKFAPTNSARLNIQGTLTCLTTPTAPAILTARDDRNYGEAVGTNTTISGYYADTAIYYPGSATSDLSNIRILYANKAFGLTTSSGSAHTATHLQIAHCGFGVYTSLGGMTLRNVLMCDVLTNFYNNYYTAAPFRIEQLTVDKSSALVGTSFTNPSLYLTNALLVAVTNFGGGYLTNSSSNVEIASDSSTVFTTAVGGSHYLRSDYSSSATTNINSSLLADFRQFSGWAPLTLTNLIAIDTTLWPVNERMASHLRCGYAYPALDFITPNTTISNATLTLLPGTAIASCATNYTAFFLEKGGNLVGAGSADNMVRLPRYDAIHEGTTANWATDGPGSFFAVYSSLSPTPTARLRFCEFSAPGGKGDIFYGAYNSSGTFCFSDCQFHGGQFTVLSPTLFFTNCLFQAPNWYLSDGGNLFDITFQNCLFYLGTNSIEHINDGSFRYRDNLFYKSAITGDAVDADYNAYLTNSWTNATTTGGHELVLTSSSIDFQTSTFGRFYLPTNSALINAGSATNASLLGFYHYTTLTNQTKELTNRLDISFHYVATSGGVPIDSDADGYADYWEDLNGDSLVNSGETDWNSATDLGLRVQINRPPNNSTIP